MEPTSEPSKFYLGICMAGAVSAGAYTAGVMDYLLEALENWEKRRGEPDVPTHQVEIPVMGGASAGGMTSVITAGALQIGITHIDKPDPSDILKSRPENPLYHSWVDLTNDDMFDLMLDRSDIDGKVVSALNCGFIDEVAERVLRPDNAQNLELKPLPTFFPDRLKVFTTLSNLGGFTYDLTFNADGAARPYYMQIHNDYACFELTAEASPAPIVNGWMPLNLKTGQSVQQAIDAAMATGAFPVGLKARTLTRPWEVVKHNPLYDRLTQRAIKIDKVDYTSLNVDGGMINNEPFDKVREVLKQKKISDQKAAEHFEDFDTFNSTVLMIAPFPSTKPTAITITDKVLEIMGLTLSAMISQMRSKPAQLVEAMDKNCAGQYLINPSREFQETNGEIVNKQGEEAIACGALGGFNGFLNKEFRVHDYFLGRYNCKIFLRDYFTIPENSAQINPIFKAGYEGISNDKYRSKVDQARQIIPVFDDVDYSFPKISFSSGADWPSQKWSAISRFDAKLKCRIEAIIMNIVSYNFLEKILIWIGIRVILRRMLANSVLRSIKTDLQRWKLLR